jgi:hypothetical protein
MIEWADGGSRSTAEEDKGGFSVFIKFFFTRLHHYLCSVCTTFCNIFFSKFQIRPFNFVG